MDFERRFIDEEHSYLAFPAKLRKLAPSAEDVQNLASFLDCSVQAVNQYKQGVSFPKMEKLIKIAHYFHCSLDYLIGLSDATNPDDTLQTIHKATGLSQDAIFKLNNIANGEDADTFPRIISVIIENRDFEYFLNILSSLISLDGKSDLEPVTVNIDGKDLSLFPDTHLMAVLQSVFVRGIPDIIKSYKGKCG